MAAISVGSENEQSWGQAAPTFMDTNAKAACIKAAAILEASGHEDSENQDSEKRLLPQPDILESEDGKKMPSTASR